MATVGATDVVGRLAARDASRTEADLQADIYLLLTAGGLSLLPGDVARLEVPSGDGTRRRLDVKIGHAVIEVKKDLRPKGVLADAELQLAGYLETQTKLLGTRYVGILTDGTDWRLYHLLDSGQVEHVTTCSAGSATDADRLTSWLEAVLTTQTSIKPTPEEIRHRLGVASPAYLLDRATLLDLYDQVRDHPEVALKKSLWAKLLRTAFGTPFENSDDLFVDHTLLVMTAEIVAHAALGLDVSAASGLPATQLTTGTHFVGAQIHGVVEADFFDWVFHAPQGEVFVRTLADRLARFDWAAVEHDVLKVLYESVIEPAERKRLGEYYTPDWLADRMVATHYTDPLAQRVLDPSCGSGTFVFHAVRAYLAAADGAGISNADAVAGVTAHVFGMDVHPVAVALARVTYLLALGSERLTSPDRPPISVPIYLGDSMQWDQHHEHLSTPNAVTIATGGQDLVEGGGGGLWGDDLIFPRSVLQDAGQFDRLVSTLADKAGDLSKRADAAVITPTLIQFGVHEVDVPTLVQTFSVLRRLRRENRNHIWGYYVRNLIRPIWLSEESNRVHLLLGNPPWLSYSKMHQAMQNRFTSMSKARGLIAGRLGVSGRDLSTLFVVRAVELYLQQGGRMAFVMPHGTLTRKPHVNFCSGTWGGDAGAQHMKMMTAWDLSRAATGFPITSCVIAADQQTDGASPIPPEQQMWTTKGRRSDVSWTQMQPRLTITTTSKAAAEITGSLYAKRFRQGAIIVPRVLFFVNEVPAGPLGVGAGRVQIESRRSTQEKIPWKTVEGLQGPVEKAFVRDVHLGETILPFRASTPLTAVLPIKLDGTKLLDRAGIEAYPALEKHWSAAEERWDDHKKSSSDSSLLERLNFHQQLSAQLPTATHRVVYTKSGSTLTAARVDANAVIDHKLYWGAVSSLDEARYLVAVLNSHTLRRRVVPLQNLGLFGPRDFDKYVFAVPVPVYDPASDLHADLAEWSSQAEQIAAATDVESLEFRAARKKISQALNTLMPQVEALVKELLPPTQD